MYPISSNSFSTDLQVMDAVDWLRTHHPDAHTDLMATFPEYDRAVATITGASSWVDTERANVDVEFMNHVLDAIEDTGLVMWEDGEPWGLAYAPGDRVWFPNDETCTVLTVGYVDSESGDLVLTYGGETVTRATPYDVAPCY